MPSKPQQSSVLSPDAINDKVAKYRKKLEAKRAQALIALQNKSIEGSIDEVFTRYGNVSITMPALATMVAQMLGATPENYKLLYDEIVDYIRAASHLEIRSGKDGGVRNQRAPIKVGTFGATCMSRVIHPPKPTHSRKRKTAKR